MIIECRCNEGFEDQLTVGHHYPVKGKGVNGFEVVNDKGDRRYYGALKFEC